MAASPRLTGDYAFFLAETNVLLRLLSDSSSLEPKYQRLVSEVVVIRLSYILDNTSEVIFKKLLAGAPYIDGTRAKLLCPVSNLKNATTVLLQFNRKNALVYFSWVNAKAYKKMIKHTFDRSDTSYAAIAAHGLTIKELKAVRNYTAHKSGSALVEYRNILKSHYGARIKAIPAGQFLTTNRFQKKRFPNPIAWYVRAIQIFIKELVRAP